MVAKCLLLIGVCGLIVGTVLTMAGRSTTSSNVAAKAAKIQGIVCSTIDDGYTVDDMVAELKRQGTAGPDVSAIVAYAAANC